MDQFFAPLTNIAIRDVGHAINAGANLIGSGFTQVHGGGNPIGNSLVQSAASSPDHVATIIDTSYHPSIAKAPASPNSTPTPVANDTNNTGTTSTYDAGGSGSTYASTPASAWTPADEANYQSAYQIAQNALGRLPGQLNTATSNVNNQYNQQYNGLRSSLDKATNQYGQDTTSNQQNRLTNTNTINQNAAQGYQSLLRILGGMGAGGGSEAQYLVPQLVQQAANQQLGGSGQTYAQNARTLDTNYNNFLNDEKNQEKQLNDWKTQQLNSVKSQSAQSEQGLQSQLAQLLGQKTAAQGGNGVAAEQPYINKINSLSDTIDGLAKFNPTFSGTTPVYAAPSLDSYQVANNAQAQVAPTAPAGSNPYLAMLLGQQQKDKNQVLA